MLQCVGCSHRRKTGIWEPERERCSAYMGRLDPRRFVVTRNHCRQLAEDGPCLIVFILRFHTQSPLSQDAHATPVCRNKAKVTSRSASGSSFVDEQVITLAAEMTRDTYFLHLSTALLSIPTILLYTFSQIPGMVSRASFPVPVLGRT